MGQPDFTLARYNIARDEPGYIYAIESNGLLKIGKSTRPEKRINELKTANPAELNIVCIVECNDMTWLEQNLHNVFEGSRVRGEWFDISDDELKQALAELFPDAEQYPPWIQILAERERENELKAENRERWAEFKEFKSALKWSMWFARSRSFRECDICGIGDERRHMVAVEDYERLVLCQHCLAGLNG